jgi:diguanylate cyclase (GGDEF)-like protein
MDERIQEKLRALCAEYTRKLPEKIQRIHAEWQQLSETWTEESFDNFHRDIHSLCGSAAIYGFDGLSKAARVLETYLRNLDPTIMIHTPAIVLDISKLLDDFDDAAKSPEKMHASYQQFAVTTRTENEVPKKTLYIVGREQEFILRLSEGLGHEKFDIKVVADIDMMKLEMKNGLDSSAIILDIDLMNKADIHKITALRQNQETTSPLICISESADLKTRLKSVRLGASAFFQKPFDMLLLVKMLSESDDGEYTAPYRVLIIDDTASLAEYYALVLTQAGMITHLITNPMTLMEAMTDFQPDLLLMDVYMPTCSGLELATVLRQEPLYMGLPIIFLSTENDKLKQLSAMSAGGDDFLMKPILPQHLVSAVRSRAKRAGILSSLMVRDSLTQQLNHATLLESLKVELTRSLHHKKPLSLIMLDIDNFKKINDDNGHLIGDYVLRKLSEFLFSHLRRIDVVGRYGGDEFALILVGADKMASKNICEKICESFSRLQFKSSNFEFRVTLSAGIASYPMISTVKDMVAAADKALYKAKSMGRNRVVHIDDE